MRSDCSVILRFNVISGNLLESAFKGELARNEMQRLGKGANSDGFTCINNFAPGSSFIGTAYRASACRDQEIALSPYVLQTA